MAKIKCPVCGCFESADAEVCRACGGMLKSVSVRDTSSTQVTGGFFSWLREGFHGHEEELDFNDDPANANIPGNSLYFHYHHTNDS